MRLSVSEGLSVAIITRNEEKNLARALQSVRFADELIVVDSGSTDATLSIAREHGCRVFERDWPGYGAQKNFALDQASHEWVLCLDADEEVSPELARLVAAVVSGDKSGYELYSFPRLTLFIDRWMRHGGWYPDRQIRLLRKGAARYNDHPVHAAIVPEGPVGRLSGDLLHYSFESVEDYVGRMNTYSRLAAEIQIKHGRRRPGASSLAGAVARKFLEVYVYKRGFLEGRHGFVVAGLAAWGVFLRTARVRWPEEER